MSYASLSRKIPVSSTSALKRTWTLFSASREEPKEPPEVYLTPYPFSVWSYHDNLPEYEVTPVNPVRSWLVAAVLFAGAALAALLWWGFAVAQVWAAFV